MKLLTEANEWIEGEYGWGNNSAEKRKWDEFLTFNTTSHKWKGTLTLHNIYYLYIYIICTYMYSNGYIIYMHVGRIPVFHAAIVRSISSKIITQNKCEYIYIHTYIHTHVYRGKQDRAGKSFGNYPKSMPSVLIVWHVPQPLAIKPNKMTFTLVTNWQETVGGRKKCWWK